MKKLTPFVYDTAGKALDQLSTKVRPNKKYVTDRKDLDGSGVDIHKWIGKLPRPKAGWTPGNYKYMGAYNPLDKQLEYDPETGEVLRWFVMPHSLSSISFLVFLSVVTIFCFNYIYIFLSKHCVYFLVIKLLLFIIKLMKFLLIMTFVMIWGGIKVNVIER